MKIGSNYEVGSIEEISQAMAQNWMYDQKAEHFVRELVEQGCPQESAVQFVDNINHVLEQDIAHFPFYNYDPTGKYKRHMLYGILWAAGGTAITVVTYIAAQSVGGIYIVAWGAIVFGIVDFFRGLFGWQKYSDK